MSASHITADYWGQLAVGGETPPGRQCGLPPESADRPVRCLRNPLAHATKTNWPMSEQDVLDILTLVSLIHYKLDRIQKAPTVSP